MADFSRRLVTTDVLEVGYHEAGPADGTPVVLLHGFPYDIHSYAEVAPLLADAGYRVIVPYLRGHGPTSFRRPDTARSGQQAALGADVIALLDALAIPQAILAGYDWGGRAACVAAALHPDRVAGLVSVNGYLIQDISAAMQPLPPDLEAGFWYFFYFLTDRGRAGLTANRRAIAEVIWRRNSPRWAFTDADLDRAAVAFDNPDYVDVVLHSYRHRLGQAAGAPEYDQAEAALARLPAITVPTVTLDGTADGNFPATDGRASAAHFTGRRVHRQIFDAGHNLPQEAPAAFAAAVREVSELRSKEEQDAGVRQ
jgi:pimeloyl-ACP methyl ester carboxylesterase